MGLSYRKTVAVTMVALLSLSGLSSVHAAICSVNLEKTYQEAEKRGWAFSCFDQTIGKPVSLNFDNSKRVGCVAKSGPLPGFNYHYTASFFRKGNTASTDALDNGWKIESYQVTGGQYQKLTPRNGNRLSFQWTVKTPGFFSKRHISELKLSKNNGNCANVYTEAFGG